MTQSVPANFFVSVTPGVLSAGGQGLNLSGLFLTTNTRVPIGTVGVFPDAPSVGATFGLGSTEYAQALVYFAGFDNSNIKPAAMLFYQYATAPVAAYLRGGPLGLTLAQMQAIKPASITASIGGSVTASAGAEFTGTGSGTTLTAASTTGYLSAGDVIAGTGVPVGTRIISQLSGAAGGDGTYQTSAATTSAGDSLTSSSSIIDVTAVGSGSLQVGDVLSGTGVTSGTTITSQLTGSAGSTGTYRVSVAQDFDSTTVTSLSTVIDVTAVGTGSLVAGMLLSGTGVTSGSRISAQLSGTTGGIGLYSVSKASTTISETITAAYDLTVSVNGSDATSASVNLSAVTSFSGAATVIGTAIGETVTYDSVSGAFVVTSPTLGAASTIGFGSGGLATALSLTQALGAYTSQGANATTPSAAMSAVAAITQNWATFTTLFNPDNSGNANKLAFAQWNSSQNDRYMYVAWDTDASATAAVPATTSLGYLVAQANYSGTMVIYAPDETLATFVMGMVASIDFTETQGKINLAFKGQSGIVPVVTSSAVLTDLLANGYNSYVAAATAAQPFNFFFNGSVSGPFKWADAYVNQIWMNAAFQLDLMLLLTQVKSIPYNIAGRGLIEQSLMDTVNQAVDFGAIQPGVTLSSLQVVEVNSAAGVRISDTLQQRGWYLQVKDSTAQTRANRGSPPCTFWYTDGGSVNKINLASVDVQ